MIICLIWYTFQKLVLEYFSINIDNIASEKERKKRRRSYDPKKRSTKNGSDPLHDHGNDSSSRIRGSSGDIRSGTGMESDLGKVVLPYGKRCLEHRFYRR